MNLGPVMTSTSLPMGSTTYPTVATQLQGRQSVLTQDQMLVAEGGVPVMSVSQVQGVQGYTVQEQGLVMGGEPLAEQVFTMTGAPTTMAGMQPAPGAQGYADQVVSMTGVPTTIP